MSPEKEVAITGDEARAEHNNQQSIAQAINTTNPISNDNGTTDKTVTESQLVPEEYYIVETAEQNPSAENSIPTTATSAETNCNTKQQADQDSLSLISSSSDEKLQPDEQSTAIVTSVMRSLKNWFFGGNLVVRVGVIVLLIGVVLLLRLLSDYIEISIELKLIAIGTAGLAIAGLGLKLVKNRFTYGMTLQGAGLAIAYLSTFFAYQVYGVLPSLPSFVLLGTLSALTVILAVRQNAFPLALLAFSGAFLAPLLTSNNSGSLTTLFSYYLLLNIAIAVIAHYRTWKVLNLLAAAVTFGFAYFLGLVDSFTTVDDFNAQRWPLVGLVTLHWLLYVFVVIRYTQQLLTYNEQLAINPSSNDLNHELIQSAAEDSKPSFSHFSSYKASTYKNSNTAFIIPIDVSLMFGVPLLAFGLLSALLSDIDNALTIASAVIAASYLGLGSFFVLKDKNSANQNRYTPLIEGMLALGFGFFALMIAIAFDAEWTACGWSIQGLALVWFGRQSLRGWTVLLGVLLQGLALASLQPLFDYYSAPAPSTLSLTISAIGCLASVFILRNENNPIQPNYEAPDKEQQLLASVNTKSPIFQLIWSNSFVDMLSVVSMIWGLIVTAVIIDDYIGNWLDSLTRVIACALLINLIGYFVIDKYRQWNIVTNISHAFLGLFYLALLATVSFYFEYDDATTSSFWPLFIVLVAGWLLVGQLWIKRWYYANNPTSFDTMAWLMTGTILIAQLSYYLLPHSKGVMTVLITGIWLIALTQLCLRKKLNTPTWFNWQSALLGCALLFIPLSVTWAIYSNWTHDGIVWGLAYLPVLNLYDLSLITVLVYLISTHYLSIGQNQKLLEDHNLLLKVAGLLGFWLLSSLLIRTLYAYLGTPLWYQGAWFNEQVQTALTIFWTLTALVLTIISSRYQKRFWWFMGIGLLGIVVLKLVVIDLSQTDTIWRVGSFLGAGSLILLIGYLAPLPPEQDENKTKLELETDEDNGS
ncbi:DUF2339 domain-containing protein [Psychrobacter phenylpyruvicus]|uniref:Predicted membrane protein n=2 Tax=Psychrobacter phenylpyruvicus TaxID=29432 RepID=A0A379LQ56_9GAMM|nr:DUF2339 domain-containing protein [Psychrobacter phenylpyruvicus]SUD91894.1 Predicted membrane protein [Psychrobacter phenylpyruvicus]